MLKALIIDDELQAIQYLEGIIRQHIPEISELRTAHGSLNGLAEIQRQQPDLLFLDIEMPHMNGFDLLQNLKEWNFGIIYTTAFNQYAIKAIKFSALDYLLKPIDPIELQGAVKRFIIQKSIIKEQNRLHKNLIDNLSKKEKNNYKIALPTRDGVCFYNLPQIVRIEADVNYSQFFFKMSSKLLVAKTLKEYSEILEDHGFIRIHKSHLVNKNYIKSYLPSGKVLLQNGNEIEVSRRRRHVVKKQLLDISS